MNTTFSVPKVWWNGVFALSLHHTKRLRYTMKLIKGEFKEQLELEFAPSIKAGFPSPAEDYLGDSLDFNRDLIKHPEGTFYAQVDGDSMTGFGINPGDIAVIDKSLEPSHGDLVVSYINEEFNIKQLDLTHQKDGYIELRSANPKYPVFRINEDDHFKVWGVVVYTIKRWK